MHNATGRPGRDFVRDFLEEDTLACVYALRSDFAKAIETEQAALRHPPQYAKEDFARRLAIS